MSVSRRCDGFGSDAHQNTFDMEFDLENHEISEETSKEELLLAAAYAGDYNAIRSLLDGGVSVDGEENDSATFYAPRNRKTPLHIAAARGHWECVHILIERGADVNAKDQFNVTAMHMAAEQGHFFCLKLLLDANGDCNLPTKYSRRGCYNAAPYLEGTTPLHLAATNNHIACVKELIDYGADFNAIDERGRTGLYIASELGYDECVLVQLRSAIGRDILSLPGYDTGDTPLHFAVCQGTVECVRELLRLGSDVNQVNLFGNSPLHYAVSSPDLHPDVAMEILQLLVLNGYNTDVNLPDALNLTPLYYVSTNVVMRRPDMARFLIAYGADVNIMSRHRITLVEYEYTSCDPDMTILKAIVQSMSVLPHPDKMKVVKNFFVPRHVPNNMGRFRAVRHGGLPQNYDMEHFQQPPDVPSYIQKQNWYESVATNPRPLLHYSRCAIRAVMGPKRLRYVKDLLIPPLLKSYILFEYDIFGRYI